MYSFSLMMTSIFMFFLCNQVIIFKAARIFKEDYKAPLILLTIVFISIMFWPGKGAHGHARCSLLRTIGHIIIAPFGPVRFRTFFFADILTSASLMLLDTGSTACFYTKWGEYRDSGPKFCGWELSYGYATSILPYHWRMM